MTETIKPCEEDIEFPVVDILTGRGFITGKSGSGKSNTAGRMLEDLLEQNFPFLIIDTEGEYYGLKEKYEILHVGADSNCDVQIGPEHADKISDLALEQNIPIVLDVSGYLESEEAKEMVKEVIQKLFNKEKKKKMPFLVVIEECHEYIPEQPQLDECGRSIIKVAKRGRKRGLGVLGISQRPADVKKDFITQANYKIWHQLDWETDLNVVRRVINKESVETVKNLEVGQALIDADFVEGLQKSKFKERETFHAGQTPTLSSFETPDLKEVSESLVDELENISDKTQERQDRVKKLEEKIGQKNEDIENLETRIEDLKDQSKFAERFVDAIEQKISTNGDKDLELEIQDTEPVKMLNQELLEEIRNIKSHLQHIDDKIENREESSTTSKGSHIDQMSISRKDILENGELISEIERLSDSSHASKNALKTAVSYLTERDGTREKIASFGGYSSNSSVSSALSALRKAGIIEEADRDGGKKVFTLSKEGIEEISNRRQSRKNMEALESEASN